ncbi:MAG: DNA topoisomerase I [Candidatus Eutrophobiaceae bacterium]
MSKSLVIVESPAKAKTLERYLGSGYKVYASYGHVRDLLPKKGAVDTENGFAMNYTPIEKSKKHVEIISKALKNAENLYLATDPDREGEAISWHLHEMLKERGVLEGKKVARVVFHEITQRAITEAMANPRQLLNELVDAQQARRALDYLVGFNLSPLLWRKVSTGLSAGRVQSPALRLISEREDEIRSFQPREYWSIKAKVEYGGKAFQIRLWIYQGEKQQQFSITSESQALQIRKTLLELSDGNLTISDVVHKQRQRQPAPPFTTSTLQQEASRKFGFGAQRTMRVAQKLYEGIDTGSGAEGLITYMRTDSVTLAEDALTEIREVISSRFGKDKLPKQARRYKTKARNAQEAHEAIRPTSSARAPEEIKSRLSVDQFKLYELIWKRTLASQMENAVYNQISADLECGDKSNVLRASGSSLAKANFMKLYLEDEDDAPKKDKEDDAMLPEMKKGDKVQLQEILANQHFTEPLPRYSEASLVKTLEKYGIGRPSTYASIIETLRHREYVEMENRRFVPTDIGKIVTQFLTEHFTRYVDYEFTARLEEELDEISRGEKDWIVALNGFWGDFSKQIEDKNANLQREDVAQTRVLGIDPKTSKEVSVRLGRYGAFAQIGTRDDEDKPKFASLRKDQRLDAITFEEAIELFKLPRELGKTPEGEEVVSNIGRFGPYIRYGEKFVSLPEEDDPYTVVLERALELVAEKKKMDAERYIKSFEKEGISVQKGRYGPYITNGKKNISVPKDIEPGDLSLEQCRQLLAKAPERRPRRGKARSKKT